jgi:predicted ArsR family transcriptional regulator
MSESRFPEAESRLKLAAHFAKAMIAELGHERAMEIIARGYQEYSNAEMAAMVEGVPESERFAKLIEWQRDLASQRPDMKIVEASPTRVAVEFHSCPTYEVFKSYGIAEVCQKYCDSDYESAKVVSPKVKLTRTMEIAYGAPYCNHCWTLED